MFRTTAAADPPAGTNVPPDADAPPELVPLSVLELDLPAPDAGWAAHLADRAIAITIDDIGRASVTRSDARRLFTEKREREAQVRELAAEVERQAIEADQLRRAQLGVGVPAAALNGMSYAEAVQSMELDAVPYRRRTSVVEDLLSNDRSSLTFHPIQHDEE